MTARLVVTWLTTALAVAACNRGSVDSPGAPPRTTARFGVGRTATSAEIAAWDTDVNGDGTGLPPGRGTAGQARQLYASRCAACHGPSGEGAAGPQLVRPVAPDRPRRTIASHWPYAPPLFDYIRRTMPPDAPWTLTDDETYSLVALLLVDSGIVPADFVVDPTSLPRVRMPSRNRFIADDRRGGPEVK
jgi:cytochrome c